MSNQDEIHYLSLDNAIRRKFEEGREGKGLWWQGRHGLVEGYDEALDLTIYMDVESNRTGNTRAYRHRIDRLAEAAYTLAGDVRAELRLQPSLVFKPFQPMLSSDPSRYAVRT